MANIYDLSATLRPDHLENSELNLRAVSHEEAARKFARRHRVKVSALPIKLERCGAAWTRAVALVPE